MTDPQRDDDLTLQHAGPRPPPQSPEEPLDDPPVDEPQPDEDEPEGEEEPLRASSAVTGGATESRPVPPWNRETQSWRCGFY